MNRTRDLFWIAVISAVFLTLFFTLRHLRDQPRVGTVAPVIPGVVVQQVHTGTITASAAAVVTHDPADQALIKKLLSENAKYKVRTDSLTVSSGTNVSTGTLAFVDEVGREAAIFTPAISLRPAVDTTPQPFKADDYRLHVTSDGQRIAYTLTQKFSVLTASGRAKNGTRLLNVKLYEVGPGDARTELPVETSEVVVDETVPRWLLGFNVQAGVVASPGHGTGYVVGLQWLKRGRADNPKDLKLALMTPVGYFAPNDHQVGLLPFSINVANLVPHQPTTNVWVSPYVGFAPGSTLQAGTINRVGIAVTATF